MLKVKVKSMAEIKKTFEGNVLYSRHADDTQTFTEGMAYFCGQTIEVSEHKTLKQYVQKRERTEFVGAPDEFYWHKDWVEVISDEVILFQGEAGEDIKKGDLVNFRGDGIVVKSKAQ